MLTVSRLNVQTNRHATSRNPYIPILRVAPCYDCTNAAATCCCQTRNAEQPLRDSTRMCHSNTSNTVPRHNDIVNPRCRILWEGIVWISHDVADTRLSLATWYL